MASSRSRPTDHTGPAGAGGGPPGPGRRGRTRCAAGTAGQRGRLPSTAPRDRPPRRPDAPTGTGRREEPERPGRRRSPGCSRSCSPRRTAVPAAPNTHRDTVRAGVPGRTRAGQPPAPGPIAAARPEAEPGPGRTASATAGRWAGFGRSAAGAPGPGTLWRRPGGRDGPVSDGRVERRSTHAREPPPSHGFHGGGLQAARRARRSGRFPARTRVRSGASCAVARGHGRPESVGHASLGGWQRRGRGRRRRRHPPFRHAAVTSHRTSLRAYVVVTVCALTFWRMRERSARRCAGRRRGRRRDRRRSAIGGQVRPGRG